MREIGIFYPYVKRKLGRILTFDDSRKPAVFRFNQTQESAASNSKVSSNRILTTTFLMIASHEYLPPALSRRKHCYELWCWRVNILCICDL